MKVAGGTVCFNVHGKSEIVATWIPAQGKPYTFRLRNQQIKVEPAERWMENVPREAQEAVFNGILAQYRLRSPVKHNLKTAALGVTGAGHIFIGMNTEHRGSDSYKRDCAEQNMINALRHTDVKSSPPKQGEQAAEQKLVQVFLMGGVDPNHGEKRPSLICPCGSCTDALSKEMDSPAAKITIFPVNDGVHVIPMSDSARYVFELKPGDGWRTTIGALAPHETLKLNERGRQATMIAFDELANHLPNDPSQGPARQLRKHLTHDDAIGARPAIVQPSMDNGFPEMARYMQVAVYKALSAPTRFGDNNQFRRIDDLETRKAFMAATVDAVEVAVVRNTQGEFFTRLSIKSAFDNSMPRALERAACDAQEHGFPVVEAWYMEFAPKAILEGRAPTPNKESIERLVKRVESGKDIRIHVIPFVRLSLGSHKLAELVTSFFASELMPGYFTGNRTIVGVPDRRQITDAKSESAQVLAALESSLGQTRR